jgi:hypothetical protein
VIVKRFIGETNRPATLDRLLHVAPPVLPTDLPHWPWALHDPLPPPSSSPTGAPDISWMIADRPRQTPRPAPFKPGNASLAALINEGPPPGRTIIDEPEIAPYQRRSALGVTLSAGVGMVFEDFLSEQFAAAEKAFLTLARSCAHCGDRPRPLGGFLCAECKPVCTYQLKRRTPAEREHAQRAKIKSDRDYKMRGKGGRD